jgi:acyl dehydratase
LVTGYSMATLDRFVGREVGVSGWTEVTQTRIDEFAHCTGDGFWLHTDPGRALREASFGGTIAHGYLSLSLLASLGNEIGMVPSDAPAVLNYGLDRVRFVAPVRVNSRVRLRLSLEKIGSRAEGRLLMLKNVLEIEGSAAPALVAQTLILLLYQPPGMV